MIAELILILTCGSASMTGARESSISLRLVKHSEGKTSNHHDKRNLICFHPFGMEKISVIEGL